MTRAVQLECLNCSRLLLPAWFLQTPAFSLPAPLSIKQTTILLLEILWLQGTTAMSWNQCPYCWIPSKLMQFVALTTIACCSLQKVIPVSTVLILIYTVWETFKGVLNIRTRELNFLFTDGHEKLFFDVEELFESYIRGSRFADQTITRRSIQQNPDPSTWFHLSVPPDPTILFFNPPMLPSFYADIRPLL